MPSQPRPERRRPFWAERARRGRLTKPPRQRQPGASHGQADAAASAEARRGTHRTATFGASPARPEPKRRSPPETVAEAKAGRLAGAAAPSGDFRREPRPSGTAERMRRRTLLPARRRVRRRPGGTFGPRSAANRQGFGPDGEPGRPRSLALRSLARNRSVGRVRTFECGEVLPRQWGPVETPAPISVGAMEDGRTATRLIPLGLSLSKPGSRALQSAHRQAQG